MPRPNRLPDLSALLSYALRGAALCVVVGTVVVVLTSSPETFARLQDFQWKWVPVLLAMVCGSWLANGGRVWLLAHGLRRPIRYGQALVISLSTEFGFAASPGGAGGTAIQVSLLHRAGLPWSSAGTVAATDAATALAFFALVTPLALLLLATNPAWNGLLQAVGNSEKVRVIAAVFGGLLLVAAAVFSGRGRRITWRILRGLPPLRRLRIEARLRYARDRITSGVQRMTFLLRFLLRRRKLTLAAVFLLTAVQWICRYGVLPVTILAFSSQADILPLLLIQGFVFLLSPLLVLPGGGGGIEAVTPFFLCHFIPLPLTGIVLVVWRFFTYHLYLAVGGGTFFWTCGNMNRVFPREETEPADVIVAAT